METNAGTIVGDPRNYVTNKISVTNMQDTKVKMVI